MQVVLENIAEPEVVEAAEAPESQEPVDADEPPEALEPTPVAPEPPAAAPAPKKRGRPPKAKAEAPPPAPKVRATPKPKAVRKPQPPVEESSDSSDIDDTLRNVYHHVAKPDMETTILQFLVNRKQQESTRRRELWGRLAQF
jgi:hypothetical protein